MTVNYQDLLRMPVMNAERPKPKPAGTYHGVVESYRFGESRKQKTPYVEFTLTSVTPGEDISQEDLDSSGVDISKWKPTREFYITNDSLYRLKDFLISLNIDVDGKGFNETIPLAKGRPVIFSTTNENVTNEQTGEVNTYTRIGDVRGA